MNLHGDHKWADPRFFDPYGPLSCGAHAGPDQPPGPNPGGIPGIPGPGIMPPVPAPPHPGDPPPNPDLPGPGPTLPPPPPTNPPTMRF
jgi:hypothetical protein